MQDDSLWCMVIRSKYSIKAMVFDFKIVKDSHRNPWKLFPKVFKS